MKCHIRFLGIIDNANKVHSVALQTGMNVVTGKSSTGKSALIEIFDYCFGSSEYTVPVGVITNNTKMYFTILCFDNINLVLARLPESNKVFIKEAAEIETKTEIETKNEQPVFGEEYFDKALFLPLHQFNKELGKYFGLTITDVDTDLEAIAYRRSKSPTPSIRSFTSFLLQHQNLVANKHAIFYRFDEKEKREQTIEHLKIFLDYVDQDYFLISQELNSINKEIKKLENQIPRKHQEQERVKAQLATHLREYASITGTELVNVSLAQVSNNPGRWLDFIQSTEISIDSSSDEHSKQRKSLESQRTGIVKELRILERKKQSIESSINFSDKYLSSINKLSYPEKVKEIVTACPFCSQGTDTIEHEANRLSEAVEWLNKELRRSPYLKESFKSDADNLDKEILEQKARVRVIDAEIKNLDDQITQIEKNKSVYEMAMKARLKVELFLGQLLETTPSNIEETLGSLKSKRTALKQKIKGYKVDKKLDDAQDIISFEMNSVGKKLDFEASYQPVNLHFDLRSFDLWHEKNGTKVFLRSMGSGANWLYCHLTLFMALHKLFCKTGTACMIPPILFIDQPTQVYFPNITSDEGEKFDASELAPKSKKENKLDDDIKSVERFFSEMTNYCAETLSETGIEPQIIVTDHADNLKLDNGKSFNDYVRARWRSRGFIEFEE